MPHFNYQHQQLMVESLSVTDLAQQYGTPLYIYSRSAIETQWHQFNDAFGNYPHLICFAVKANSNIGLLNLLAKLGSGFDVVSQGELERVLVAGGDPNKVVFSGVAKSHQEITRALEVGIRCFNVESESELLRINQIATKLNKKAPISLRVNPDIDAKTHPYISTGLKENKFGVSIERATHIYHQAQQLPHIDIIGLDCHIGSQLTELQPFLDTVDRLITLITQLKQNGITLKHLDLGGGLGVRYTNETPPSPKEYITALLAQLSSNYELEIILEPGRAVVANAGILVTKVEYLKQNDARRFAIVDAGMNDLIRPALYQAYMDIVEVKRSNSHPPQIYDVVGPICETSDFLGKQRQLSIEAEDLLAVRSAGAYGATMSSTYNSRPRAAEILVDKDKVHLIRERESFTDLWHLEKLLTI